MHYLTIPKEEKRRNVYARASVMRKHSTCEHSKKKLFLIFLKVFFFSFQTSRFKFSNLFILADGVVCVCVCVCVCVYVFKILAVR